MTEKSAKFIHHGECESVYNHDNLYLTTREFNTYNYGVVINGGIREVNLDARYQRKRSMGSPNQISGIIIYCGGIYMMGDGSEFEMCRWDYFCDYSGG